MRLVRSTRAHEVPAGAELVGGPFDGKVVSEALVHMPVNGIAPLGMRAWIVLKFVDESELVVETRASVLWLEPETNQQGGAA